MTTENRGVLVNSIILRMNEIIAAKNKELCNHNLYADQLPRLGFDTFIQLAFLSDKELDKITKAAGI